MQHLEAGRAAAAEPLLEAVLAADPRQPDALHLLGVIAHHSGRHQRAVELVRQALAVADQRAHFWRTLGQIEAVRGQAAAAEAAFRREAELAPDSPTAHNNLGLALRRQAKLAEAEDAFRRALVLDPDSSPAYANLGAVLFDAGRDVEAAASLRRALELGPAARATRLLLVRSLMRQTRYDEAASVLRQALITNPGDREAGKLLDECQAKSGPDGAVVRAGAGITRALELEANRAEAARVARRAGPAPARIFERTAKPKLRVGYLSGDFRQHAVANVTAEVFELHDRSRFEIRAYSTGPDDASQLRARLQRAFDSFTDLRGTDFRAAANRIAADGVDLLVDLSGYTEFGKPEILALRAAPIQINFLGYPGTLGADFVDYIIADCFIVPPEHAPDYAEAVAYLPDCYMPGDRKRVIAEPRPTRVECGLPADAFVFCCFNGLWKVTSTMLELWAGLLREVAGSVLWLRDISPAATRDFRAAARHFGLEDRFVFAARVDDARHLARMACADLFLDTLPYNAHSTASDALWAGLPLLTCVGDNFPARLCGSILTAAGLPELITGSLEEYRALALRLARDPAVLRGLRQRLAATRLTSRLFDSARFTRNLEALYVRMWERFVAGEKPAMISVAPTNS